VDGRMKNTKILIVEMPRICKNCGCAYHKELHPDCPTCHKDGEW
jgi:predicted Zn-ribbon and HTH transcriptional regulator